MNLYTINYIKNNQNIYKFLREESSYYKQLNRNQNNIKIIEEIAKEKYNDRTIDKIDNLKNKIELITNFIDVLK